MAGRPRRKRRRPQRLCEQLPDSWGRSAAESDDADDGDNDSEGDEYGDSDYEGEYVEMEMEEVYQEECDDQESDEEEKETDTCPPNLSPYFHRVAPPRKRLSSPQPWWRDRFDAHVAFACVAGSFVVLSLVLGLLALQTGAMDGGCRRGGESKWLWNGSECLLGAWRRAVGGIGGNAPEESSPSSWSAWSWPWSAW